MEARIDTRLTALPSVTTTAKPADSPVAGNVNEGPGSSVKILNQPVPLAFRESVRYGEQSLLARARELVGEQVLTKFHPRVLVLHAAESSHPSPLNARVPHNSPQEVRAMPSALFDRCAAAIRAAEAAECGCDIDAFETNALTVIEARPSAKEPELAAYAVTFGAGSVLRVEPGVAAWVAAHNPNKHFRIFQPFFLADLAAATQAITGGRPCSGHGLTLGFVPHTLPEARALPPGYRLAHLGARELAPYRDQYVFENSLGDPDEPERLEKTLAGFAVIGPWGEAVALAGVWDEGHGRYEIGLDVRRAVRGLGLAAPAVAAATRWILAQGRTPIYTCGATNVRSHRVALACGYRPLWTLGSVRRAPEGKSPYLR